MSFVYLRSIFWVNFRITRWCLRLCSELFFLATVYSHVFHQENDWFWIWCKLRGALKTGDVKLFLLRQYFVFLGNSFEYFFLKKKENCGRKSQPKCGVHKLFCCLRDQSTGEEKIKSNWLQASLIGVATLPPVHHPLLWNLMDARVGRWDTLVVGTSCWIYSTVRRCSLSSVHGEQAHHVGVWNGWQDQDPTPHRHHGHCHCQVVNREDRMQMQRPRRRRGEKKKKGVDGMHVHIWRKGRQSRWLSDLLPEGRMVDSILTVRCCVRYGKPPGTKRVASPERVFLCFSVCLHSTKARVLFSSENFLDFVIIAFSFLFNKYYSIID